METLLHVGLDVPTLLKYQVCAMKILHNVGFGGILNSGVKSPLRYMGLDVPILLKSKECVIE